MEINWFKKDKVQIVERLINTLESEDLQFVGKFIPVENKDFGFFKDVRSVSGVRKYYPKNDGSPDELNARPLEVWSKQTIFFNEGKNKIVLQEGKWYKFNSVPAQRQLALKISNPFLLQTDLSRAAEITIFKGNELIENIQQDSIRTPESVKGKLTRSIEAISNEINTQPATFIFELIQNADDYPNDEKDVSISFSIKSPYLVVKHNGSEFDVNNAVAICDINEGDKRSEVEKIGFKGIGFKSIFKDCNLAYLKSGDYSFRFDERKWLNEGRKIFWQITPINTDDKQYQSILVPFDSVNLVMQPREEKQLTSYKSTLIEHFRDERILLFLRNVKQIYFNLNDDSFSISKAASKWKILNSRNISVDLHIQEELNRGISLNDRRIPLKFQGIEETDVGFGFLVEDNIVKKVKDATIYAYLPTKVNLGFGFLINGNFIPDGSRTHLHRDINWNNFLFEKAGEYLPEKLLQLIDEFGVDASSVLELIPNFDKLLNVNDDEIILFVDSFRQGFFKAIEDIELFPNTKGGKSKLRHLILDETGVSSLLKNKFFKVTGMEGHVLSNNLSSKAHRLVKKLMLNFEIDSFYTKDNLSEDLDNNEFKAWLLNANNSFRLIRHCSGNDKLKEILEDNNIFLTSNQNLDSYGNLYNSLPKGVPLFESEIVDEILLKQLEQEDIHFDFKEFEPSEHLRTYYYSTRLTYYNNLHEFNMKLLGNKTVGEFWGFICDYFDDIKDDQELLNLIKQTVVLSYEYNENEVHFHPISECYLSDQFIPKHSIEMLVKQLNIPNTRFISGRIINETRTSKQWRKIFKKLDVITNLQQVITQIIEQLDSIPEVNHFQCGVEIFNYWKQNKSKETRLTEDQLEMISEDLKVLTNDNEYRSPEDCFLSDHYLSSDFQTSIIPSLRLPVTSDKYEPNPQKAIEWKDFFSQIGCVVLQEKREVLCSKLSNIEFHKKHHFSIIEEISSLHGNTSNSYLFENISFDFTLLSDKNEWVNPANIHFSSTYKPKLDLQSDSRIKKDIYFLNSLYNPKKVSRKLLKTLGVNDNFSFSIVDEPILIKDLIQKDYIDTITLNSSFKAEEKSLKSRWTYSYSITDRTFIKNFVRINYPEILQFENYFDQFIQFAKGSYKTAEALSTNTELCFFNNRGHRVDNYPMYILKKLHLFQTEGGERNTVENLISKSLSKWVVDKNRVPLVDLTERTIGKEKKTLEEIFGISQELDLDSIIALLKSEKQPCSLQEMVNLGVVELLQHERLNEDQLSGCHIFSTDMRWVLANEIFYNEDDLDITSNNLIHENLIELVHALEIQPLREDDILVRIAPDSIDLSEEILEFFKTRGKYIAFEIEPSHQYESILDEIISEVKNYNFYQVDSIEEYLPYEGAKYSCRKSLLVGEDYSIYFVEDWRVNSELHGWFAGVLLNEQISNRFLTSVLIKNENDLVKYFEINYDNAKSILFPEEKIPNDSTADKSYIQEVNDFILNELEGTEWGQYITELKKILELDIAPSEHKKLLYNRLAKLKLSMARNIHFENVEERDREFNYLEGNGEKYIVHSARGSFAYIAPIEILKMKNEGFMMALDFGKKKPIKIYSTAEEILLLNTNHLLLYQNEKTIDELFAFCKANQSANKRLLIIDKDHASNKAKEMLKYLIPNDEY